MQLENLFLNTQKATEFALKATRETQNLSKKVFVDKAKSSIDNIETYFRNVGEGYKAPNFPLLCKELENLESGLYVFAGESNSGKTCIMSNIFWDFVLHKPNKLYGIYFSLDDSKKEIYPRIIAMQQNIPIGCVKKPKLYEEALKKDCDTYSHYIEFLSKREIGFNQLREQAENVIILDTSVPEDGASNADDMYTMIKNIRDSIKKEDETANIIVGIDAIDDIQLKHDVNDKDEQVAKLVKQWAITLDIPIFATKHLKKLNANRRPMLDDLRQSNTLVYETNVTFIVYNDVSKNKQQAKVFYLADDDETKRPIIEIDWAKNKKSSYKGIMFAHLVPEFSKVYECDEALCKHYERSVYSL